ncbi:MAG: TIGR04211 family SH3 domain-containing protein [Desulfamplus sp.]|nr:TIGR04211 family SH3 domain-containing protein [Desulfamplus sp.]
MLILSLKEGPGRQYTTTKTLRSNTKIEIIETADRFIKVRTEEGDIGWVESQYITKELPKAFIIEQLNKKIALLEGKNPNSELVEDVAAISQIEDTTTQPAPSKSDFNIKETEYINKIKSLETDLNSQLEKNRLLETQLKNSKSEQNQIKLEQTQKNTSISNSNIDNSNIIENDIQENSEQENSDDDSSFFLGKNMMVLPDDDVLKTSMIKWFCAGAGVMIAGWFIGRSFSAGGRRGRGGLLD